MSDPRRQSHLLVLGVCLFILAAAAILHPGERSDSRLRLAGRPLPGLCVMRQLTGLPCPGCGLTRSIVSAVHGDVGDSFFYHRLGGLVFLYVLLQALTRLGWLLSSGWRSRSERWGTLIDRALVPLAVLLAINWVFTLGEILVRGR